MSKVRKFMPKTESEVGVKRALTPFTHSMEDFLESFLPRQWMGSIDPLFGKRPWGEFGAMEPFSLRFDMIDHDSDLKVRVELPGVRKEDVHIAVSGDYLTIEAEREFSAEEKTENFFRSELGTGMLTRSILLPVEVEADNVMATLKEGILEITLPKVRAVKRHEIKVA
ncbi:MAG: Hsp20/alpha crystallin family protein [Gammaproteobacteria bacterium]|nr:Hsp20/alpha crystallin family protein [Gammaproteobacteria bacterium]